MISTQHTGATISQADAEDMLAEVRKIMATQQLNYGPAIDEYIKRRQPGATFDLAAQIAGDNYAITNGERA